MPVVTRVWLRREGCFEQPHTDRASYDQTKRISTQKNQIRSDGFPKNVQNKILSTLSVRCCSTHFVSPSAVLLADLLVAKAMVFTFVGLQERNVRLLTNSRRLQSEKQGPSRARKATARKPQNKKSPRPTPLTGREHVGGGSRGKKTVGAAQCFPVSRIAEKS